MAGEAMMLTLAGWAIHGSGVDLRWPLPPDRGCPPLLGWTRCMRAFPYACKQRSTLQWPHDVVSANMVSSTPITCALRRFAAKPICALVACQETIIK